MDDLKRVGLARMLQAIHAGRGGYELLDGLDDMVVDTACERLGQYRATPLTSVHSAFARACLTTLLPLAARD
jgi:hypothetical protein